MSHAPRASPFPPPSPTPLASPFPTAIPQVAALCFRKPPEFEEALALCELDRESVSEHRIQEIRTRFGYDLFSKVRTCTHCITGPADVCELLSAWGEEGYTISHLWDRVRHCLRVCVSVCVREHRGHTKTRWSTCIALGSRSGAR